MSYHMREAVSSDPIEDYEDYNVKQGSGYICKCGCIQTKCFLYPKTEGDNIQMRDCDFVLLDISNCTGWINQWTKCTQGKNLHERKTGGFPKDPEMIIIMKKGDWP